MANFDEREKETQLHKFTSGTSFGNSSESTSGNTGPLTIDHSKIANHSQNGRMQKTMIFQDAPVINSVAWLYCSEGLRKGALYQLTEERSEFGRNSDCQLVIEDEYVSSRHGALLLREGVWSIVDFASTTGTFVNGKKLGVDCAMSIEVEDEDIIRIGKTELIFKRIKK